MFIELLDICSDGLHANEHDSDKWTASDQYIGERFLLSVQLK